MQLNQILTLYKALLLQLTELYQTHFSALNGRQFDQLLFDLSYPNRLYGLHELRKLYDELNDTFSPTRFTTEYVAIQYRFKGENTREVAFKNDGFERAIRGIFDDLTKGKECELLILKHKNIQGPIFKFTQKEKDISKWLARYEPSYFKIIKHENKTTFGEERHHVFSVYFADAIVEDDVVNRTKPLSREEKDALKHLQREQNIRRQSQAYSNPNTIALLVQPEKLEALIKFREGLPYQLQKLMYWLEFKHALKATIRAASYAERVDAVKTLVEIHNTNTIRFPWVNEPFLTEAEFDQRGNESDYMRHHLNRLTRF